MNIDPQDRLLNATRTISTYDCESSPSSGILVIGSGNVVTSGSGNVVNVNATIRPKSHPKKGNKAAKPRHRSELQKQVAEWIRSHVDGQLGVDAKKTPWPELTAWLLDQITPCDGPAATIEDGTETRTEKIKENKARSKRLGGRGFNRSEVWNNSTRSTMAALSRGELLELRQCLFKKS